MPRATTWRRGVARTHGLQTSGLNKHLQSYMKGLTAKVFRTYNASITFQTELDKQVFSNASVAEKIKAYNEANRKVAILCNHQRSIPKGHSAAMEKANEKVQWHMGFFCVTHISFLDPRAQVQPYEIASCNLHAGSKDEEEARRSRRIGIRH